MKKIMLTAFVVVLFTASCSSVNKPGTMTNLLQGKWNLQSIAGQNDLPGLFSNKIPFLNFDTGGLRVSGNSGCNNLSGSFAVLAGNKINLGPLASTKMACPGSGEQVFLSTLGSVTHFKIKNGILKLLNGKEEVMRLVKAE